ncbi:hypothetical protein Pth03_69320 [Planotetraspora thailandica]|uniref:Uncharacterized protein n=1 Tax=Planotetraspora thailandica TaxID=487172 RepID=A0A8J4DDH0_9ACTN|nr:hypothetical protein Pth03_69320 [Planotetraspora thailandica]
MACGEPRTYPARTGIHELYTILRYQAVEARLPPATKRSVRMQATSSPAVLRDAGSLPGSPAGQPT